MSVNLAHVFSAFMVLFAVIDIIGSIPIILDIKSKGNVIETGKITIVSFLILLIFLFTGEALLGLFGVDISSFAIAGSLILFILAIEMIFDVVIFKNEDHKGASIVPIAFPLIAGAGSITSLLSLRAEYSYIDISIALLLNMVVVFIVLKSTKFIEKSLGQAGIAILKKVFGIILLSIAIKLFMSNVAGSIEGFFPGLVQK